MLAYGLRRWMLAVVMAFALGFSSSAFAAPDYRGLVDRIDALLHAAAEDYAAGQPEAARAKVQKSYFEIFENLEGPIRVNVSAKRSFELEAEFGKIRKLIKDGVPVDTVRARIEAHVANLDALVPELEKGFVIRAEATAAAEPNPLPTVDAPKAVQPHWAQVVESIAADLRAGADAYMNGDAAAARERITRAQFAGYKNSLLETAVRRHVSQRRDAEFNAEFGRILGLVRDGDKPSKVAASGVVLAEELREILPGLPLIGAAAEAAQAQAATQSDGADWAKVSADVMAEVDAALAEATNGKTQAAVARVQDAYFDLFEASGMENRVGARDAGFKTALEAHFSKIAAMIAAGRPASEFAAARQAMAEDLDRAAKLLGGGGESPVAMFVYAMMIILREGVEAMLIVAAIVAYLAKTGHSNKIGVIRNSVLVALAASVVTAVAVKLVFNASAASQEVLEGATMLLAAVVLFSMSYWLVSKAEAEQWMAYIRDKVGDSLSHGSLKALWFASFLAVYREGAETVLFYQALLTGADAQSGFAVAAGFGAGCVGLGAVYLAMRFGAMKLALRPFFMITGGLLYLMAFVFAGKGVMELVEGKVIHPQLVPWLPEFTPLGIFPYWQTAIPQLALIAAAIFAWMVLARRAAVARAQSAE